MKVVAIALLVGFAAGSVTFFLLGYWKGRKPDDRTSGGAKTTGRNKEKTELDMEARSACSAGKEKRVVPQSEWKRGRIGGGLS